MKDFIWFVETVDIGVDVGKYPRVLYQGSLKPGRHRPRQEQENAAGNQEEEKEGGEERRGQQKRSRHGNRTEERGTGTRRMTGRGIDNGSSRKPQGRGDRTQMIGRMGDGM